MGGVAVLHPQDYLNDNNNHNNLFLAKPRRNPKSSTPNLTRSDGRKRSPRKNKPTAPMVVDPPAAAAAAAKTLVMGQVKILKRGEPLDDESLPILKQMNDRKVTNTAADTPEGAGDRKVVRVTPVKKKLEKVKRSLGDKNIKVEGLRIDDFALSSTNRLGPDPEMVPKRMNNKNNNIADFNFFAGSAFVDSPPPSSVPLPGFFNKSFVKEDPSSGLRRMLGLSLS